MNDATDRIRHHLIPWASDVPLVLQSEVSECGLACLAMIYGYYTSPLPLYQLRQRLPQQSRGATLHNLIDWANTLKLQSRAVKAELHQLDQLQTPCIIHWDLNHFVVMANVRRGKVCILDPARGKRWIGLKECGEHYTGIALELSPRQSFSPVASPVRLTFTKLFSKNVGLKRSLAWLLLLSGLAQAIALASPYYLQTVIDSVILSHDETLLLILAAAFVALLVIECAVSWVRQTFAISLSGRLKAKLSNDVLHHLYQLPLEFFQARHVGDLVSRFRSLEPLREALTTHFTQILLDALLVVLAFCLMWMYSTTLTSIVLVSVTLFLTLKLLCYGHIKRLSDERLTFLAQENSHFIETLRAIASVKQNQLEHIRAQQWQHFMLQALNQDIRIGQWDVSFATVNKLLFGIENIIIIYLAALAVMANSLTVGMLFAFISYKTRFTSSANQLITKGLELALLRVHLDRLSDVVMHPCPTVPSSQSVSKAKSSNGSILLSVRELSYYYDDKATLFKQISFDVALGETIAIIGASGVGKSTLLKCISGLIAPKEGSIEYCFQNERSRKTTHSKNVACVFQDDQLFAASIAENISCFATGDTETEIVAAAQLACIHHEILAMPMQYQTLVGDLGSGLSSGQIQRLLIARALFKQPQLLLLDESSSHLDTQNEQAINQNLSRLKLTRIIVAHRPQTIATATRVYQLINQQLIEQTAASILSPATLAKSFKGETHE